MLFYSNRNNHAESDNNNNITIKFGHAYSIVKWVQRIHVNKKWHLCAKLQPYSSKSFESFQHKFRDYINENLKHWRKFIYKYLAVKKNPILLHCSI